MSRLHGGFSNPNQPLLIIFTNKPTIFGGPNFKKMLSIDINREQLVEENFPALQSEVL